FSGIVKLDGNGAAKIPFDVPDFQGQLRLMAVAYSAKKLGSASGAMIVRDPVVTMVSLPRFLAPGDTGQIGVVINNLEGGAGDYRLTLAASGAGNVAAPAERTIPLKAGEGFSGSFPLSAATIGNVALYLEAVAGLWRTDPGFNPGEAVDRAIGHVVELQRSDGSFGVWSATEDTVPWLDAYATDFLLRAKEHGKNVPDYALKGALAWLRDYVRQEHREKKDLPALAYAHYVLAHAGAGDLATLRYFNDTQMAELPTQLAK